MWLSLILLGGGRRLVRHVVERTSLGISSAINGGGCGHRCLCHPQRFLQLTDGYRATRIRIDIAPDGNVDP